MTEPDTSRLHALCADKVAQELVLADREVPGGDLVSWSGNPLGRLVLVKGDAGPAEESGGAALSGPDGAAARAALDALGIDPDDAFMTLSRPVRGVASEQAEARLLRQIEAVDPHAIVALDAVAAADVAAALGMGTLVAGRPVADHGRTVLALEGLEASLSDPRLKLRVWAQLKHLSLAGPVW